MVINDSSGLNHSEDGGHAEDHHASFHLVSMQFSEVKVPFFVTVFLLLASGVKTVFHLSKKVTKIIPESCLLVILGVVVSLIMYYALGAEENDYNLNSDTFFFILLPPVVFDAGYFMPNRAFFQNLGTILLYAVIGTIFNTAIIGLALYLCDYGGFFSVSFGLLPIFTFAALISAVDPVAVLAVFEEIHVNEVLHILVFGESLLNDAVTVVIYHMMETFTEIGADNLKISDIFAGIASFFFVSIGGTLIGVMFGFVTAFVTKYTGHVRVIEPIFVFAFSYLSYITAEIFHFSGILAIVFCGITMAQYVEENITQKSHTTIKYFLKMTSSVSEAIIFLFLGLSTSEALRHMDILFVIVAVFACLVFRFAGVYLFTALANRFRVEKLDRSQQFIMAYGGIRGGVAFCLAVLLSEDTFGKEVKGVFVSTTIIVVFFTVFIQGITIKPLVHLFRIKTQNATKLNIFETMADRVVDHVMSGIEDVSGRKGQNWLRVNYETFNNRYLRRWLLRDKPKTSELNLMNAFSKLNLQETVKYVNSHQNVFLTPSVSQNSLSNYMRKEFEKHDNHKFEGLPGYSETCLDMRPMSRQTVPNQKMLEDAETHRATMETAFQKRSKGIVSGAQIQFTNPRHAIPIPSSRVMRKSVSHHMENYNAMSHHMINSRIHKKSLGGLYDQRAIENGNASVARPSVSFMLPTPGVDDLDRYLHSTHLPTVESCITERTKKISDVSANGSTKSGKTIQFKREESCESGMNSDDGITFSVPARKVHHVKIQINDEDKLNSSQSDGDSPDGNDSQSIHSEQIPVAIEAYLPWKDSIDLETPSLSYGFEEAPQSQHVFVPPGQDMTLEEWDKELPENLKDFGDLKRKSPHSKHRRHHRNRDENFRNKKDKESSPKPKSPPIRKRKSGASISKSDISPSSNDHRTKKADGDNTNEDSEWGDRSESVDIDVFGSGNSKSEVPETSTPRSSSGASEMD